MNFFERIPTSWLLTGAAVACLLLWAGPGWAQSTDSPANGKLLFEDTPNVSGVPSLGTCTNCHASVQDRRTKIGGSAFADITFETAMTRFGTAISGNLGGAMGQFAALDTQQVRDIASYIADTPKVTATNLSSDNALPFVASASGVAVTQNLTISQSVATTSNLTINSVSLSSGTTAFTRSNACNGVTRGPSGTCTFSVTYTPSSTTAESKTLTIALQQGSSTFNRVVTLNGSVQGATTPPPAGSGSSDEGGGALGLAWLGGLALATAVLARRRRD